MARIEQTCERPQRRFSYCSLFKKESLPFFIERKVSENVGTVYKLIDASNSVRNILYCWVLYLSHNGFNIPLSMNYEIRSFIIVRDVSC